MNLQRKLYRIIWIISVLFIDVMPSVAQQKDIAERLVNEGILLHDKGLYDDAIVKYNIALALDKNNLFALTEKSFSQLKNKDFLNAASTAQLAIREHPYDRETKTVYITYGNAMDLAGRKERAVEIYTEGIAKFPLSEPLYFNKGITLSALHRVAEAIESLQQAAMLNPSHAATQDALGRLYN